MINKRWIKWGLLTLGVIFLCYAGYLIYNMTTLSKSSSSNIGFGSSSVMPEVAPPIVAPEYDRSNQNISDVMGDKIAINSDISLTTTQYEDCYRAIYDLIDEMKGKVISTSIYLNDSTKNSLTAIKTAYFSIKIPSEQHTEFLNNLQELGVLQTLTTYTNDESTNYINIDSRVKNLKVQEERYRELMSETKNLNDILQIESELVRIRSEIDSLTQQLNWINDRVDYSTVNITLMEEVNELDDHRFIELSKIEFINNLSYLGDSLKWIAIKIIGLVPYMIVIVPLVTLIVLGGKKIRKK